MTSAILRLSFLGALWAPSALAADGIGLAMEVSDAVTLMVDGEAKPVEALMKLREGDALNVPAGGLVEVMYFEGGKVERWSGPAAVILGVTGGAADGVAPIVSGGASMGTALAGLDSLAQRARESSGGHTMVRGGPLEDAELGAEEQAEVDDAREEYDTMRAESPPTDVMPELYLAGILVSYELDKQAATVLEDAATRCPTCAAPKALLKLMKGE